MEKLAYIYALIKALFDEGEDYIDAFWPIVIKTFPNDKAVDLDTIKNALMQNFSLDMPLHVLKIVIKRARRKGYIEVRGREYKLTNEGIEYLSKLETDREVARRINALLEDMHKYFTDRNFQLHPDQLREILSSFLYKNVEFLKEFINPSIKSTISAPRIQHPAEFLLIDYIKSIEHHKPEHYKTLQDMILGSIISLTLASRDPSDITEIKTRKFKSCQVFLDTNFVFYILDLHTPEFNKPAKELFNLLKKFGFKIKVFTFTVDEICKVIHGYTREADRYPISLKVDSLYSSLKRKGWTKMDAIKFIANIENILHENGIEIEWQMKDVNLNAYTPKNEGLRNILKSYKPDQSPFHQNHDLAAIDKIKEIRGRKV